MKFIWLSILSGVLLVFTVSADTCKAAVSLQEYYAKNPKAYATIKHTIQHYYPDFDIDTCRLEIIDGEYSKFNVATQTIFLAKKHEWCSVRVLAHELSHLALASLTNGENLKKQHRFFDEGFANIVGYTATGALADYKVTSIHIAVEQIHNKNLEWKKVQDWDMNYDRYGKRHRYAYLVGSSFNFFIIDTYGLPLLFDLFLDISITKDIESSIQNIWSMDVDAFEQQWVEYLLNSDRGVTELRHFISRMNIAFN